MSDSEDMARVTAIATTALNEADLQFVLMVFSEEGQGAVLSNIDPADALKMMEGALKATRKQIEPRIGAVTTQ